MNVINLVRERLELRYMIFVMVLLIAGIIWSLSVSAYFKNNLYSTAEENLDAVATIVTIDITRAMHETVEKKSLVSNEIINGLKTVKSIDEVKILNAEGREAFNKTSEVTEADVMQKISKTAAPFLSKSDKTIVFYKPFENTLYCKSCHAQEGKILGAVKVGASLEKIYGKSLSFILWTTIISIAGIAAFTLFFWIILRRIVLSPIRSIETACQSIAEGDLSFKVAIKSKDEIGRLSKSINTSIFSLGGVINRIKGSSKQALEVSEKVETEFEKVSESSKLESESIANIASSLEQMNSAAAEISKIAEHLTASAEETSASMSEMVTSISQVAKITQELSVEVDSTTTSVEELSATTKEIVQRTQELTASSEETLAATEEILSSVKEVEQNAKKSAMFSEKVKNDASSFGIRSVEKTIEGMQNIKSSVEKTADLIMKLGSRSNEIGKILNVIEEITDQTTLLALNAAILASQAGEHGKGFSVVADEIKDLAERTSLSTQEIASLIQTVQKEVKDAIQAMNEGLKSVGDGLKVADGASDALKKIIEVSKQSADMALAIDRSTEEQTKATRFVSASMERVKNMVSQVAMATSEQNKGVSLIAKAAEKVRDVTTQVKTATSEQLTTAKRISSSVEFVTGESQKIATSVSEQKTGSSQILLSVEKIKEIPKNTMNTVYNINLSMRSLFRSIEIVAKETERFKLYEESTVYDMSEDVFGFGIEPVGISPVEAIKRFAPLAEYLSKKLGRKVNLKPVSGYESAIRDIGYGITHACYMAPTTYVEANKKYGVQPLVKALTEGKSTYRSVIITRSNSGINSIEDIKGRTFAFGDPHSVSSYIAPMFMLLEAGIDCKDLLYYKYFASQQEVLEAVVEGKFDAGGITDGIAHKFKDKGIKCLKFSEELPVSCICASRTMPEKDRNTLKAALISLSDATPEGASILHEIYKRYTGFKETSGDEYTNVRVMMLKLGML
ncbi:MAG: phosphate/phosphite/phosphonate ABC transporter substrate-binding protein [Nitrospirota bacterium]